MKNIINNSIISLVYLEPNMSYDIWQNSLDDDNRKFVPDEVFETLEEATEVVNQLIESYKSIDGPFIYPVIRNSDNANLGYVQLVKIEEGWEIGYHIAKKYTGNGYATEAVKLFLEYLKKNTSIKEIYGIALYDNKASKKVLEKCRFKTIFKGKSLYQGNKRKIIKTIIEL